MSSINGGGGGSRRGSTMSAAGFMSDMESSKGNWSAVGSESNSAKSPLANFGFFKSLTGEKKTTRGLYCQSYFLSQWDIDR